jgi:hypothetical protein
MIQEMNDDLHRRTVMEIIPDKCIICGGEFEEKGIYDRLTKYICKDCNNWKWIPIKEHKEPYIHSIQFKQDHDKWDNIKDIFPLLEIIRKKKSAFDMDKWTWLKNSRCKYIEIRIDTRDGGCIIRDRDGNRISPKQLMYQYSENNPDPIKDEEAYK